MAPGKHFGLCLHIVTLVLMYIYQTDCQSCSNLPSNWIGKWRLGTNTGYLFQANSNSINKIRLSDNTVEEQYQCASFFRDPADNPGFMVRQNVSNDKQCIQIYQTPTTDIMTYWDGPIPTGATPSAQTECSTATFTPPPYVLIKQDVTIPCDFFDLLPGSYLVQYKLTAQDSTYACIGVSTSVGEISGNTLTLNSCFTGTVNSQTPLRGATLTCRGDISNPVYIGGKASDLKIILLSYTDTATSTTYYYCGRILSLGMEVELSLDVTQRTGGVIQCLPDQTFTTVTDLTKSQDRYIALKLTANDCALGKCLNGGTCSQSRPGSFDCNCVPGFTGDRCETNIDECASSPCQNGGTCRDEVNQFICECGTTGELSGVMCETRNLCFSNPCQNLGGCARVDNNNYKCTCPAKFTGVNCETELFCVPDPCLNSGTCSEQPGDTFLCTCPTGYTGTKCETRLFCVLDNSCQNGATCAEGATRAACNCRPGFTGVDCETELFCVTSNNCRNGATCTEGSGTAVCNCVPGTTGTNCETQLYCQPLNPCQHAGTCTEGTGKADCSCPSAYTGPTCETELKCVSANPCKNGATCSEGTPDPTCTCATGYTGTNCESTLFCQPNLCRNLAICEEVPRRCVCQPGWSGSLCDLKLACQPVNPCLNGGTCTEAAGISTCACPPGYTGALCETTLSQCDSSPCKNGGVCSGDFSSFSCTCTVAWQGTTCEQEKLECPARPCVNSGTCDTATKTCTCPTGFTGPLCQTTCTPTLCPTTTTSTTTTTGATTTSTTLPSTASTTTPSGGSTSQGAVNPTGSSGGFDWLPVIITLSIVGGLLLIGMVVCICVCCTRGATTTTKANYGPPPGPAITPTLIGPAIITAAPQPFFTSAPPTVVSVPPVTAPYVEEPAVSTLMGPSFISVPTSSKRGVAPAPPKIKLVKRLKVPKSQLRPTSIMRNSVNKPQSEVIVPKSEPIYYGTSKGPSSVRYSGVLTNRPINSSIRNLPPTNNYIDAEFYPDL